MVKCGAQPVMYTYPAWTFGGKRKDAGTDDQGGPGYIGARSTMGTTGPVYGPRRAGQRSAEPYGDGYIADGNYLKPGYVSKERAAPAYSFGARHPDAPNANPGPLAYDTNRGHAAPTSSWGPPPRSYRPASAPRPHHEERPAAKAKGPSFGLQLRHTQDLTPGPLDYQCGCGGSCCRYCDSYNGVTLKGRRPQMYGKVTTITPGPAAYHTECSTIGVATVKCSSSVGSTQPQVGTSRRRS